MNRELIRKILEMYPPVFTACEEGGFTVEIPDFPGCVSEGESREEAQAGIEEAAGGWIATALESGRGIPPSPRYADSFYSEANQARIRAGIEQLARGEGREHELIEPKLDEADRQVASTTERLSHEAVFANEETHAAMREAERLARDPHAKRFSNMEGLLKDLNS